MERRVVITGLGVISPVGNTIPEFWNALKDGKSGVAKATRFDMTNYTTQIGAEIKNFDPSAIIEKKELRRLDLSEQYALVAAHQAYKDAGLNSNSIEAERAGVIVGSGIGGVETLEKQHSILLSSGPGKVSPFRSHDDYRYVRWFDFDEIQLQRTQLCDRICVRLWG